jgi:hypothetical protein
VSWNAPDGLKSRSDVGIFPDHKLCEVQFRGAGCTQQESQVVTRAGHCKRYKVSGANREETKCGKQLDDVIELTNK